MSLDIVVFFFRKRSFSTWIGEEIGDICFQFVASNWAIAGVHPRNKDIVFVVKVNIVGNKDKVDQWCWRSSKFSKCCKCRRLGNVDDVDNIVNVNRLNSLPILSQWHCAAKMFRWFGMIWRRNQNYWKYLMTHHGPEGLSKLIHRKLWHYPTLGAEICPGSFVSAVYKRLGGKVQPGLHRGRESFPSNLLSKAWKDS